VPLVDRTLKPKQQVFGARVVACCPVTWMSCLMSASVGVSIASRRPHIPLVESGASPACWPRCIAEMSRICLVLFDMNIGYLDPIWQPYIGSSFQQCLAQAVLNGCIPVVVQEHVHQFLEDVLPYWTFSLRLRNADLDDLEERLQSIPEEDIVRMQVRWPCP
jgi:hypothetical protein